MPHLLNSDVYYPMDCEKIYDVTYIAHLKTSPGCLAGCSDVASIRLSNDEKAHRILIHYLESLSMEELASYYSGPDELRLTLIEEFYSTSGVRLPADCLVYLRDIVVLFVMRTRLLKYLLDNGIELKIWGQGWDQHPYSN